MFELTTKKLAVSEIWGEGFSVYKKTIKGVWYIAFLEGVILSLNILFLHPKAAKAVHSADATVHHLTAATTNHHYIYLIVTIAAAIIGCIFNALLLHRIRFLADDNSYRLGKSLKIVGSKFIIILIATVLSLIFIVGGYLLLVIPGIFLGILFIFFLPKILFDDAGMVSSITGSYRLVWGNWWRTFFVMLIPIAIIGIINLIVATIIGVIIIYLHHTFLWLALIVSGIAAIFTWPYFSAVLLLQFYDLKRRQTINEPPKQTES